MRAPGRPLRGEPQGELVKEPHPGVPLFTIQELADKFRVHPKSIHRILERHRERFPKVWYTYRPSPQRGVLRVLPPRDFKVFLECMTLYVKENRPRSRRRASADLAGEESTK